MNLEANHTQGGPQSAPLRQERSEESADSSKPSMLKGLDFAAQESALAPPPAGGSETKSPKKPNALDDAMGRWKPRMTRVTDPVAFMTSAGYDIAVEGGTNLKSDAGFFGLALGEIAALQNEMAGMAQALTGPEGAELQAVAAMLGTWSGVYSGIRDTGMDREGAADPARRAKVHGRVRAALDTCGASVRGLVGSSLVGMDVIGRIGASWDEISLFVDAWGSSSGIPGASPYMWGAFLQTIQRYRQILNQYGELEARGGDTKDTGKIQVKDSDGKRGMVSDGERFQEVSADKGGTMALALEHFSYRASNVVACQKQVEIMLARVEAGEFKSADEAAKAFRAMVGAGLGSESFNKNVELLARGAWLTNAGAELVSEGERDAQKAYRMYVAAKEESQRSRDALGSAGKQHERHKDAANDGDGHRAEARWDAVMAHRQRSSQYADEALALVAAGDGMIGLANKKYADAEVELANARLCLEAVDVATFPHLAPGVRDTEAKVATVRQKLSEGRENAERIKLIGDEVRKEANNVKIAATDYRPEKEEVPTPAALDEEGVEVNHFQKFSFGAYITPHPILTIHFKTSGEWGQVFEPGQKGKTTNYAEGKVSGGVELDLFLFKVEGGYEQKDRYEVDANGIVGPIEVVERGSEEKNKWQAAKEIHDSGAEAQLVNAFTQEQAKMAGVFEALRMASATYRADGNKGAFMARVQTLLPRIDEAHAGLKTAIIWRGGGDWIERCMAAGKLPSPKVMKEDVQTIARSEPEQVEPMLSERKADHDRVIIGTRDASQKRFREAAGFSNDPNVRFKSTGTAWFGVKADVPGAGSFGVKAMQAETVSDGDGDEFDFKTKTTNSIEFDMSTKAFEGTLTISRQKDDLEVDFDSKIKGNLGGEKEQKKLHSAVRDELRTAAKLLRSAGSLYDVATTFRDAVSNLLQAQLKDWKAVEPSAGRESGVNALLGFNIGLPGDGPPTGSVSIGFSREVKVKAGTRVVGGEVKYEGGMKVTVPIF